ncbi:S8 family serine peptidase [Crocinitomicaceae bacterium]|nr:S8 family serine peptidase [Crocinitomicaceae bacterium]
MKTLKNTIRTTATAALFSMASLLSFSQQDSKVWLTIENSNNVPTENASGVLVSTDANFNAAISSLNITNIQKALPSSRTASLTKVYEVSCDCDVADLYTTLTNNVSVVSKVEYAPVYQTLETPDDYTLSVSNPWALELIGAKDAWNVTTGDANVVIAISDQNYFENHEELVGKFVHYDHTNTASQGHGTAVATLAAGATNNTLGKSAIGYNSSLALYRMNYNEVLDASYAGAKVVNLSWTSGCSFNQYLQDVMDEVYNNGTFIIASAGNGSTCGGAENLVYPAAYDKVFAVTSIGENDNHERTIGNPNSTHQHNASVDLSAPGYDVPITAAPGWYLTGSGTSYASPIVAGTVGLMIAANPCLTNIEIEYILKNTSTFIDDLNPAYAGLIGQGRLNAAAAVEMAKNFNKMFLNATSFSACTANSGQIDIDIVGGNAPFTTVWSNGATDLNLTDLAGGDYTVTITDAIGCSKDTTITIADITPTVFVADVQHVACNGSANGAIDITIIEGTPGYTFEWETGHTTEDLTGLTAGTYRLKITDGNGCSVWGSFNVMEAQALTATLDVVQPTASTDGDIDLTVEGGTAPYSYTWNTGDVSEDLFGVPAGYYQVTVIDANGCDVMVDKTIQNISTASVNNLESVNINVFPNPTSDYATVTWDNNEVTKLTVVNANGQVVENADVDLQNNYTTQNLNAGMYFINLTDNNNNTNTKKLIVR